MELDAASRTGVDDIRDILDGVRYKPTNCRYKIYIIDEVHMLSKSAFNALLKTLEEPPAHVKFIFATTEIRKVPVTVLSRCQRFDLQRLSIEDLLKLFNKIIAAEDLKADDEALHMIATAADGSARDGLSLLDQAISLGGGKVRIDIVKEMLGMADRGQTFELFNQMVGGDMQALLGKLQEMYRNGANPAAVIGDLINLTHALTKTLLLPGFVNDASLSENDRNFLKETSGKLSIATLSKIWQMLIKGMNEMQTAPVPIDALEMILIRIAYSANLPSPAELLESVKKKSESGTLRPANSSAGNPSAAAQTAAAPVSAPAAVSTPAQTVVNAPFSDINGLIKHLENQKQPRLAYALRHDIEVVEFSPGQIKFKAADRVGNDTLAALNKILEETTGGKWALDIVPGEVGRTVADIENEQKEKDKKNVAETPLVKAILEEFRGARIENLTRKVKAGEDDGDESANEDIFNTNSEDYFNSED